MLCIGKWQLVNTLIINRFTILCKLIILSNNRKLTYWIAIKYDSFTIKIRKVQKSILSLVCAPGTRGTYIFVPFLSLGHFGGQKCQFLRLKVMKYKHLQIWVNKNTCINYACIWISYVFIPNRSLEKPPSICKHTPLFLCVVDNRNFLIARKYSVFKQKKR